MGHPLFNTDGRSEMWIEVQALNLYPIKFFAEYELEFTFTFKFYLPLISLAYEYPRKYIINLGEYYD
jgi:hypothetical protein